MSYQIHIGSNLDVLPTLPDNSVDSIVTDPPYELGFMGKSWDSSGIAYNVTLWRECLRVLKPGGHLLAFSGSRTYHRMTCAIEDAGFEVRDQIMWVYGSGFPKSHNISKAMIKHGEASEQWDGWGTALKPAHEPICVARKPLEGTVVDNICKWGVGGMNIDACRVGTTVETWPSSRSYGSDGTEVYWSTGSKGKKETQNTGKCLNGRWPANLIHDGSQEVLDLFPNSNAGTQNKPRGKGGIWSQSDGSPCGPQYGDSGSAARFFYCAKASKSDRNDGCKNLPDKEWKSEGACVPERDNRPFNPSKNNHPTVKPTNLMAYLCRLVTPPGGTILDPFMGSGSTGRGAVSQGFNFIGIELSDEYAAIAEARIKAAIE